MEKSICIIDGHEYVDLGLPSGTKWATCNVGADESEENGDYFAWGETEDKSNYIWKTYKFCDGNEENITKYNSADNKKTLDPEEDAATMNWGECWRLPTIDEMAELRENCEWENTNNYKGMGVSGKIGTSKINGNTIFFPLAGFCDKTYIYGNGERGFYWSSSIGGNFPKDAEGLHICPHGISRYYRQNTCCR